MTQNIGLTPQQEVAVIIPTPSLPSLLDPANDVNLSEKKHSWLWVWEELQVQPRAAVATRDVLVLEGGAHLRPPRQAAVTMDTTVDGSYTIAEHREATKTTAHPHGTNRRATCRMVNGMAAVSVAVGHKSHAETIEVRSDHAREVRAKDPAAPRAHQTFAPRPKTNAVLGK